MSTMPIFTVAYWPNGDPDTVRHIVKTVSPELPRVRTFSTYEAANDAADEMSRQHGSQFTYTVMSDTIDGPDPTDGLVVQHANAIDNLRNQLETCQSSLRTSEQRHDEDIEKISEKLIEEANDRGWCSEYDNIVDALNERLHVKLLTRAKDYTVTFEVIVSVPISVTTRDDGDAVREARELLTTHAVQSAVREQGFDERDYEVDED